MALTVTITDSRFRVRSYIFVGGSRRQYLGVIRRFRGTNYAIPIVCFRAPDG